MNYVNLRARAIRFSKLPPPIDRYPPRTGLLGPSGTLAP